MTVQSEAPGTDGSNRCAEVTCTCDDIVAEVKGEGVRSAGWRRGEVPVVRVNCPSDEPTPLLRLLTLIAITAGREAMSILVLAVESPAGGPEYV